MTVHVPVLFDEVISSLEPALKASVSNEVWYVDGTFGGGGHAGEMLKRGFKVFGIDRDPVAVQQAHQRFEREIKSGQLVIENLSMMELAPRLEGKKVAAILADLGFSSDQIENRGRGFSFQKDEPLDMRMNPDQGFSALEWLNEVSEKEMADAIFEFGEERYSRKIARFICEARARKELPETAAGLAHLIERSVPPAYRHGRIHAATRTFQAIRILVNQEMEQLDALLDSVILKLAPAGRMGVISFHSMEDRKVKHRFRALEEVGFKVMTKKPIEATEKEIEENPRSRSAKYRVIERL